MWVNFINFIILVCYGFLSSPIWGNNQFTCWRHHAGCPFVRHSLSVTFATVLQGVNADQMCCPILSLFTEAGAHRERSCPVLPSVIVLSFKQRLTKLWQDLTFITGKERAANTLKETFKLKVVFHVTFYMISNKFVHILIHQMVL